MKARKQQLKKIRVDQLELGMFVTELCGSWMDHPFWNSKFKLEDPADLVALQKSAVSEVWIDISRGKDLPSEEAAAAPQTTAEREARNESALKEVVEAETPAAVRLELEAEVARAAAICENAKVAVTEMFGEARMGKAVDTRELEPLVEEISGSVMRNPGALIGLARLKTKDDYTYMHSVAVCGLMIALARQLGMNEQSTREAGLAGLVHDVGKATVDLDILNKPGKLTDAEFTHMKLHPVSGHALLQQGEVAGEIALDVCLHHHEKVDGSGYPERLSGDAISLYAKMGAVCDVYDAITSDRPYKAGWDPATAIRRMNEWSAGHFEPSVFQAFVKTVGIYPVGSLVRLESGLLAVVCEVADDSLLTPVVKTFYCTRRNAPAPVRSLDLGAPQAGDRIAAWENPERWNFPDLNELWAGESAAKRRANVA